MKSQRSPHARFRQAQTHVVEERQVCDSEYTNSYTTSNQPRSFLSIRTLERRVPALRPAPSPCRKSASNPSHRRYLVEFRIATPSSLPLCAETVFGRQDQLVLCECICSASQRSRTTLGKREGNTKSGSCGFNPAVAAISSFGWASDFGPLLNHCVQPFSHNFRKSRIQESITTSRGKSGLAPTCDFVVAWRPKSIPP